MTLVSTLEMEKTEKNFIVMTVKNKLYKYAELAAMQPDL